MDNNDQVIEMTELVIDALSYAHKNSLDITSEEDVRTILQAVDSQNADGRDIEKFMELLKATDDLMNMNEQRRKSIN